MGLLVLDEHAVHSTGHDKSNLDNVDGPDPVGRGQTAISTD